MNNAEGLSPKPLENYPLPFRYDKYIPWLLSAGILLGASIVVDNIVSEETRCVADNADGWVDFHPIECLDVFRDFIG